MCLRLEAFSMKEIDLPSVSTGLNSALEHFKGFQFTLVCAERRASLCMWTLCASSCSCFPAYFTLQKNKGRGQGPWLSQLTDRTRLPISRSGSGFVSCSHGQLQGWTRESCTTHHSTSQHWEPLECLEQVVLSGKSDAFPTVITRILE